MEPRPPIVLLFSFLAIAALIVVGCGATPIDTVEAALLGTWHGEAIVRPPISFAPPPKDTPRGPQISVSLDITVHEDASVTGTIGGAELTECVLKRNRGDLGRRLNIATDYIIMDGHLEGAIIPGDEELHKDFTLPFNLVEGRMRGSINWLKNWRYPSPLLGRVELVKT